jgi:hypothetical protein
VPTLAWNEDILETKRGRKLFASPFHFPAWNEDILETKRGRKLFASPFHFPLLLGPFDKPGEPHILDQAFSDLRHRNTRASAH